MISILHHMEYMNRGVLALQQEKFSPCENGFTIVTIGDKQMKLMMLKLFIQLLDDDGGVSEEVFRHLVDLADHFDYEELKDLLAQVEATDGRYYLPK